ncbi:MAG: type II/IV secretion system protein [Lentisphaeria bacterium]|nr:type II/IV secretion system protein [Lentisphaeria bacterium]
MNYNPIFLAVLGVWLYSGIYTLNYVDRRGDAPEKGRALLNLAALFAGPAVLLLFAVADSLKKLRLHFSGLFSKAGARRKNIDIELLDSRGQPALDSVGGNDSGEAIFRTKYLVFEALCKRASDIFFDPKPNGNIVVRYRVDGALKIVEEMDAVLGGSVISAIKVAAGMDITEKRRPQDGAFSCESSKGPASFRVASVGAFGGEKVTIRVLSSTAGPMTLKDAGVSGEDLKVMQNAIRMPSGMILMCGPTGSGKTSTLYAMLSAIDYSMKNVISIEDPIEHVIENISQMEVNTKADITFAKLLRNALRQNPDIICLGEIRDEETAQVAAHAAQTGHLIIATVHSNDNLGTIDRLVNLGVPLRSVAATLQLIVSQRLVRKLCHCRKPAQLTPEQQEYFEKQHLSTKNVCAPAGCRDCDGTGYEGRTALFDLMVMNNSLRTVLEAENATLSSIKEKIEEEHGSSILRYEGCKLVAAGITSMDEIERVTLNLEKK